MQISLRPPTAGFNCQSPGITLGLSPRLFNSIHTQEGQSCSDPGKATSFRIYPGGAGDRRWVSLLHRAGSLLEVLFLSTAAAATLQHINCYFPFPEPCVPRTSEDWVKVSRSVQRGGRDRLEGGGGAACQTAPPHTHTPRFQPGSWVTQPAAAGCSASLLCSQLGPWVAQPSY